MLRVAPETCVPTTAAVQSMASGQVPNHGAKYSDCVTFSAFRRSANTVLSAMGAGPALVALCMEGGRKLTGAIGSHSLCVWKKI